MAVFCLGGCAAVAEAPPSPPQGAQDYRPADGVPYAVQRAENFLLAEIEDRFKPVGWDLYSLGEGATFEQVAAYYGDALTGWQAQPAHEGRGVKRQLWVHGDDIMGIAFVEGPDIASTMPEPVPEPVIVVLFSRD